MSDFSVLDAIVGGTVLLISFAIGAAVMARIYRRRKKVGGYNGKSFIVKHNGRKVRLMSRWELRLFARLREAKIKFEPQPKPPIPYVDQTGVHRTYTPDFLIYNGSLPYFYIEVKPSKFITPRLEHKIAQCEAACKLKIEIWSEVSHPFLADDDLGGRKHGKLKRK